MNKAIENTINETKVALRIRYNRFNHVELIKKCIAPFISDFKNKNIFENFLITKEFTRGASVLIVFSNKNTHSLNKISDTAIKCFSDFLNQNPSKKEEVEDNSEKEWFMNYPENSIHILSKSEMERYNLSQNLNQEFSDALDIYNTNFTKCTIETLKNIEGKDYETILTILYELLLSTVSSYNLSKYESKSILSSIFSKISKGRLNIKNQKVKTIKLTSKENKIKNQLEKDFQDNYENIYSYINENWIENSNNKGQNTNYDFINYLAVNNNEISKEFNLSKKYSKMIIEYSILNFFSILNLNKYTNLFTLYSLSKCLND